MTELCMDLSQTPFSLEHTLRCGQVFGWRQTNGWWIGVVDDQPIAVTVSGNTLKVRCDQKTSVETVFNYFGLQDDLQSILNAVSKDPFIAEARRQWYGLRICRQEPWECLVTYLCSIDSNIGKIELCLNRLRQRFGRRLRLGDKELFAFPTARILAKASDASLMECSLGFRTRYLVQTANRVATGEVELQQVAKLGYSEAMRFLTGEDNGVKSLLGVGPKVADCVLLFSMGKLEAFPLDVWMRRVVARAYRHLFDEENHVQMVRRLEDGTSTMRDYRMVSEAMRGYFGRYAGYAQEYLFQHMRALKGAVGGIQNEV